MAKIEGCVLIQLTTDKQRIEKHKFYEKLGFESSHYDNSSVKLQIT